MLGSEREASKSIDSIDKNLRVLIKKGPVSKSMDTSLKELRRMRGLLYIYMYIIRWLGKLSKTF